MSEGEKIAVAQEQIKTIQADMKTMKETDLPKIYDAIRDLSRTVDTNKENTSEQITKLRISLAKYVGIAVGAVGFLNILVTIITVYVLYKK